PAPAGQLALTGARRLELGGQALANLLPDGAQQAPTGRRDSIALFEIAREQLPIELARHGGGGRPDVCLLVVPQAARVPVRRAGCRNLAVEGRPLGVGHGPTGVLVGPDSGLA